MAKRTIDTSVVFNEEARKLTEQLPFALQRTWALKATRKAATVVQKEAKKRAPSSEQTGTRNKWSAGTRAIRSRFKETKRSIKTYILSGRDDVEVASRVWAPAVAWIEYGHNEKTHVQWGRETDTQLKPKPFIRPAADSTLPQQQQAVIDTLRRGLKEEVGKYSG